MNRAVLDGVRSVLDSVSSASHLNFRFFRQDFQFVKIQARTLEPALWKKLHWILMGLITLPMFTAKFKMLDRFPLRPTQVSVYISLPGIKKA